MEKRQSGSTLYLEPHEAGFISTALIDSVIERAKRDLDDVDKERAMCAGAVRRETGGQWSAVYTRSRSKTWWCIRILAELERRGWARKGIKFSHQAVMSLAMSEWIWERVAQSGESVV